MNRRIYFVCCILLLVISCSHYDELQKNGIESASTKNSHNAGRDCMSCHHNSSNEASDRWWYVAGTAYNSNGSIASAGGEVQLWTNAHATGTMLHKLAIDHSGNFYTEKIIDFKGGYFPVIISGQDTFFMSEKLTGDQLKRSCNNCHGNNGNGINTPPITLK